MTAAAPPVEVRKRLLIFGDSRLGMARLLLEPFAAAARAHAEVELIGVCDTARVPPSRLRRSLRRTALRVFDRGSWELRTPGRSLSQIAQRLELPVLIPGDGGLNSAEFRRGLRDRWLPDLALSLGCLQIFEPALLACFRLAVNLHDGLLPNYRGLDATAWSVYRGERLTGYSFHHMTAGIDTGPVLVEGWVEVAPDSTLADLNSEKFNAAAARAPEVIAKLAAGNPGRPQAAGGAYFSGRAGQRIRRIADPAALTAAELERRLRCFGRLELWLSGRCWAVTQLSTRGRPRFRSADGRSLGVRRAESLPPALYRLWRALQGAEAGR